MLKMKKLNNFVQKIKQESIDDNLDKILEKIQNMVLEYIEANLDQINNAVEKSFKEYYSKQLIYGIKGTIDNKLYKPPLDNKIPINFNDSDDEEYSGEEEENKSEDKLKEKGKDVYILQLLDPNSYRQKFTNDVYFTIDLGLDPINEIKKFIEEETIIIPINFLFHISHSYVPVNKNYEIYNKL